MPLSDQQKMALLQQHGASPDMWDVQDDGTLKSKLAGSVPQMQEIQEEPEVQVIPQGPSAGETFGRKLIDVAPSALVGGLGAAGGWAAGAALAGPTGGLSLLVPLGLSIAGAYGASTLERKAQEALETENYKKKLAEAEAAHPTAAAAGQLAALPLGGFMPTPTSIGRTAGALAKIPFGISRRPEETQALVNTVIGGGLGSAQAFAQGERDPKQLLKEAAIGGLFSGVNPIGKMMGFHTGDRVVSSSKTYLESIGKAGQPNQGGNAPVEAAVNPMPSTLPDVQTTIGGVRVEPGALREEDKSKAAKAVNAMAGFKQELKPFGQEEAQAAEGPEAGVGVSHKRAMQLLEQQMQMTGQLHGPFEPVGPQEKLGPHLDTRIQKILDFNKGLSEKAQELVEEQQRIKNQELVEGGMGSDVTRPEVAVGKGIISPLSKIEAANARQKEADLQIERQQAKAAGEPEPKYQKKEVEATLTPAGEQLLLFAQSKGLDVSNLDPSYFNTIAQEVSAKHGIVDKVVPNVKTGEGGQAAGRALIGRGMSLIQQKLADIGTPFHELFHHIWDKMSPQVRARIETATKEGFDAYNNKRALANKEPITHEEYLALEHGWGTALRLADASGEGKIGGWWGDFKAKWAQKYGGDTANAEQLFRSNIYDMINGHSNLPKTAKATVIAGQGQKKEEPKFQESLLTGRGTISQASPKEQQKFLEQNGYMDIHNLRTMGNPGDNFVWGGLLPNSVKDVITSNRHDPVALETELRQIGQPDNVIAQAKNWAQHESLLDQFKSSPVGNKVRFGDNIRDENGSLMTPFHDVRTTIATSGIPTKEGLERMGYVGKVYDELVKSGSLGEKVFTGKTIEQLQDDIDSVMAFIDPNKLPTPQDAKALRDAMTEYTIKSYATDLFSRSAFRRTRVTEKPDPTDTRILGQFTAGRANMYGNLIEAKPARPSTSTHEALHEMYHETLVRNPGYFNMLITFNRTPDFQNTLASVAQKMKNAGYEDMDKLYTASLKFTPKGNKAAAHIIDEAMAQTSTTENANLRADAHKLINILFGPKLSEFVRKSHVLPEAKYNVPEHIAGWDPVRKEYFQQETLGAKKQPPEYWQKRRAAAALERQEMLGARAKAEGRPLSEVGRTQGIEPHTRIATPGYEPVGMQPRRTPWTPKEITEEQRAKGEQGDMEIVRNVVRNRANRIFSRGAGRGLPQEAFEEIYSNVIGEMSKNGLDVPKPFEDKTHLVASTAGRRTYEAVNNYLVREKQRAAIEGVSLQKKVGRSGEQTLEEKIAGGKPPTEPTEPGKLAPTKEGVELEEKTAAKISETIREEKSQLNDVKSMFADAGEKILSKKTMIEDLFKMGYDDPAGLLDKLVKQKKILINEDEVSLPVKAAKKPGKIAVAKPDTTAGELAGHLEGRLYADPETREFADLPPERIAELQKMINHLDSLPSDTPVNTADITEKLTGKKAPEAAKYQTEVLKNPDLSNSQKVNVLWVRPMLDAAQLKAGSIGQLAGRALRAFFPYRDQLFGKYTHDIFNISRKMNPADKQAVLQKLYNEDADGKVFRDELTPVQQKLYDVVRKSLVEKQTDQRAAGQKVVAFTKGGQRFERDAEINPTYFPSMMDGKVIDQLMSGGAAGKAIEKRLVDFWVKEQGATEAYAQQRLEQLKGLEDGTGRNETRFGANRLSEGMGLPPEFRMRDFDRALNRYFSRVVTDRAWFDKVENNPDAMKSIKDSNGEYDETIKYIKGEPYNKDTSNIKRWNKLFTSMMLGPTTNVHIGFSSIFNPMNYLRGSEAAGAYARAVANYGKASETALKNGYARHDTVSLKHIFAGNKRGMEYVDAAASLFSKLGGRQLTDHLSKSFAQSISEQIVPLRYMSARGGDVHSINLMKQLDPYWSPEKNYTPDEMSKMASILAGYVHGAHDPRTLPAVILKDTAIQPFFSLTSWTVAQTNQWMKHVWYPATKGNIQPLLMSTLGAVLGGYAIQQVRQFVTDRKSPVPSIQEIMQSSRGLEGNIPLLAYNFIQMAGYTGFAGLYSVPAKAVMDIGFKNQPAGFAFPLDEGMLATITPMTEGVGAWLQNPTIDEFFRIMPRAVADIAKGTSQLARIVNSWGSNYELTGEEEAYGKKVSTATGELRRWKMAEGLPYEQQVVPTQNPYVNLEQKQFKHTANVGEAMKSVPSIFQLAMERSQGQPEILSQQLQAAKANSYQTLPSPERMPIQFARYYQYLQRVHGPEVAQQKLQDYMRQNTINKMKSSMIPTL